MSPVARGGDPWTSWAAARSITDLRMRQAAVLHFFVHYGPCSLSQLVSEYHVSGDYPRQSPSGLRTRARELMDRELICEDGIRINTNRRSERILRASDEPPAPPDAAVSATLF